MLLLAVDFKLAFIIFAVITAFVHASCALTLLFYYMKNPPKSGPSINQRFLMTLVLGAVGFVYCIYFLKEKVDTQEDDEA